MEAIGMLFVAFIVVFMVSLGQEIGAFTIDWPMVGLVVLVYCFGLGLTSGLMHRAGRGPLRSRTADGRDCSMDGALVAVWPLWLPIWAAFRAAVLLPAGWRSR